tara:strand:+ start:498 stop:908 length:411 start_codon:yes stop_codon:yes gene_type:complete
MKGVKFRGISLENGEWVYGFYVYSYDHDKHFIFGRDFDNPTEVDPHTVGQYAFMANDQSYYHGDIIELDSTDIGGGVYEGYIVFNMDGTLANFEYGLQCSNGYLSTDFLGRITLLGNVHTDPEVTRFMNLPYTRLT